MNWMSREAPSGWSESGPPETISPGASDIKGIDGQGRLPKSTWWRNLYFLKRILNFVQKNWSNWIYYFTKVWLLVLWRSHLQRIIRLQSRKESVWFDPKDQIRLLLFSIWGNIDLYISRVEHCSFFQICIFLNLYSARFGKILFSLVQSIMYSALNTLIYYFEKNPQIDFVCLPPLPFSKARCPGVESAWCSNRHLHYFSRPPRLHSQPETCMITIITITIMIIMLLMAIIVIII